MKQNGTLDCYRCGQKDHTSLVCPHLWSRAQELKGAATGVRLMRLDQIEYQNGEILVGVVLKNKREVLMTALLDSGATHVWNSGDGTSKREGGKDG